jgi:hypothetical protein
MDPDREDETALASLFVNIMGPHDPGRIAIEPFFLDLSQPSEARQMNNKSLLPLICEEK